MGQSKQEYLAGYKRLCAILPERGEVLTPIGLGRLVVLDLDQDSGYGVGVRLSDGKGTRKDYRTEDVFAVAEVENVLAQLFDGCKRDYELRRTGEAKITDFLLANGLVILMRETHYLLTPNGYNFLKRNERLD